MKMLNLLLPKNLHTLKTCMHTVFQVLSICMQHTRMPAVHALTHIQYANNLIVRFLCTVDFSIGVFYT